MIYTFGNSHAHLFTNTHPATFGKGNVHPNFTSYSLGATIAYNFYEHHLPKVYEHLKNIPFDKNNDYVMLIVGEVDCRWHLPYQAHIQNTSHENIVNECINRYFQNYIDLVDKGYKIIGWGGHPSTTAGHSDNPSEPIFGDCLSRNAISLLWNEKLKEKCLQHNIPYISIINNLIDPSTGLTKTYYFSDYCHLNYDKLNHLIEPLFIQYL